HPASHREDEAIGNEALAFEPLGDAAETGILVDDKGGVRGCGARGAILLVTEVSDGARCDHAEHDDAEQRIAERHEAVAALAPRLAIVLSARRHGSTLPPVFFARRHC